MHRWIVALMTLSSILPATAEAQRTFKAIGKDLWTDVGDIWYVWKSPFHAGASDWKDFGLVMVAGAAISPLDDDIDRWVVRNPESLPLDLIEHFREDAKLNLGDLSVGRRILPASGIMYLIGFAADNRSLKDAGLGCAAAQQTNSAPRHVLYEVVKRRRPSTAEGDQYLFGLGGGPWEEHSLVGGHVANAVGCAAFLSERFQLGVAEPVLYTIALAIGVARVADRRHWTSDQFIGIVGGYAVGRTIAHRQLRRLDRQGATTDASPDYSAPRFGRSREGYRIGWTLSF
jgi:hypothetical protein